MINLIPPDARRAVVREYWLRVVVVVFMLLSAAFLLVGSLNIPSYVLIDSQLVAYEQEYTEAQQKKEAFEDEEKAIKEANQLAKHLGMFSETPTFSELIAELDALAGTGVVISQFSAAKTKKEITSITISGTAYRRSDLTSFSDRVEAHPLFMQAEVPLSNLAKDSDIFFQISVVPAKSAS